MSPWPSRRFLIMLLLAANAAGVFINNDMPRVDINNNPIDVHDGQILQWEVGGRYFWYGMGYGNCIIDTTGFPCAGVTEPITTSPCGFQTTHRINIFSSTDLVTWRFEAEALPFDARPLGIYFRPKVVFNPTTSKYVLWVNAVPADRPDVTVLIAYRSAHYVVATADTPTGPFTVVKPLVTLSSSGLGDFDILVEGPDAHMAYTSFGAQYTVAIVKLDASWTDSTALPLKVGPPDVEAPVFLKYQGGYYLMFGSTCCFCYSGSGVRVWYGVSALGPWFDTTLDIGLEPGTTVSFARAQQSFVFTYEGALIWAGDQWGRSLDGTKGHVFQYWVPLQFNPPIPAASIPALPAPLQLVFGFDSAAPTNLAPYATGWCQTTDATVLAALAGCQDVACQQAGFQAFSVGCQRCFGAGLQRGFDPATLPKLCFPPGLTVDDVANCTANEVPVLLQLKELCALPGVPNLQCQPPATLLQPTLSASCRDCTQSTPVDHLLTVCVAKNRQPADACLGRDASLLYDILRICLKDGVLQCPTESVALVQQVGANCLACAQRNIATPDLILPLCIPADLFRDPCANVTCSNGGICSWATRQCLCADGWQGPTCEVDPCAGINCLNGGNCSRTTLQCTCTADWTGPRCATPICRAKDIPLRTKQGPAGGRVSVYAADGQLSLSYRLDPSLVAVEAYAYAGIVPVPAKPNGEPKTSDFTWKPKNPKLGQIDLSASLASLGILCSPGAVLTVNVAAMARVKAAKGGAEEAWAVDAAAPVRISTKEWPTYFKFKLYCGCVSDVARSTSTNSESDAVETTASFPWAWLALLVIPVLFALVGAGLYFCFRSRTRDVESIEATFEIPVALSHPLHSPAPTTCEGPAPLPLDVVGSQPCPSPFREV